MNIYNWKNELENLRPAAPREVPPFLFTRILEKIAKRKQEVVSPLISWSILSAMAIWLVFQITLVTLDRQQMVHSTNPLNGYELMPNNALYHE